VPAMAEMHLRNGAVAISYIANALSASRTRGGVIQPSPVRCAVVSAAMVLPVLAWESVAPKRKDRIFRVSMQRRLTQLR
jgi:hypothetical protein